MWYTVGGSSAERCGRQAGVPCDPTVSAAANSVGVAPHLTTAVPVPAKSNAAALPLQPVASRSSSKGIPSTRCSSTATTLPDWPEASTPTMPSLKPPRLSPPSAAASGDVATRMREIAAFLGQTSHETRGGWDSAPDGPYAWGYCFNKEPQTSNTFCDPSTQYPCAPGKQYYGRGPFQLSWNFNYGQCGRAIGVDLLNNPELVATYRSRDILQEGTVVLDDSPVAEAPWQTRRRVDFLGTE